MNPDATLLAEAQSLLPAAIRLRRDIHAHPELGLELPRTQGAVLSAIEGLGLSVTSGRALSSVVAVLDSGRPGPTVLLRGDMDALPMPEDTGLDFASTNAGATHACGHDSHVAMLVGAASLLRAHVDQLKGRVVFMFQPGEEGEHGARFMIDEGVLDIAGRVDLAFAIHQSPNIPSGMIATKGGTLLASADEIFIDVVGRGGHASMPYLTLDPIPVACEIVLAIQSMITRKVDVFDPAVVTIAHVSAGTTSNVIPEVASIHGTVRAISAQTRQLVHDELARLVGGIAAAHAMTAELRIELGFPVTVNDAATADWTRAVSSRLLGEDKVVEMASPVMGAEDFSYVLENVPGTMVFLGTCPDGTPFTSAAPNHSNRMILDESAMATGIALHAAIALARSAEPA
jgi:hippurate hydrolase